MPTAQTASEKAVVGRLVSGWMRLCAGHPRSCLLGLGLLVVLAALAIPRLSVDADSSKMLSSELPAQIRAAELNEAFPGLKTAIVVVVQSGYADAADLAVERIVEALSAGSDWIEWVYAPSADPFMTAHGILYRDLDEAEAAFSRLSKSANMIARLRSDQTLDGFLSALDEAAALAAGAGMEPGGLDRLYAETANVLEAWDAGEDRGFGWTALMEEAEPDEAVTRLITVTPILDTARLSPARPALDVIEAAIADLPPEIAGPVTIGVTGEPALRAEEMQSVLGTIGISSALSMLLVAAILWVGLGSASRLAVAFASLVVSLVLTTGFAAVAVGTLNLVSVAFVVLMVGLGVDFAIHIMAHVRETRRLGTPPLEAVSLTGLRTGLALCLSALTTAVAFLAFAMTDFAGMAQLGLIGSAGVLIALATAATLIPASVALWPRISGSVDQAQMPSIMGRRRRYLPLVTIAIGAAALVPASQARFDADPMALRDPDSPSVAAFQALADRPATSPYRANILASSREEAAAIAARFEDVPGVAAAVTIDDLVPRDQDAKLMLLDFAAPPIEHAVRGAPTEFTAPDATPAMQRLTARLSDATGEGARLADALTRYAAERTEQTDAAVEQSLFRSFPLLIGRLDAMLSANTMDVADLPDALSRRFVSPDGIYRVEVLPKDNLDGPAAVSRFVETVTAIAPEAAGGPVQLDAAGAAISASMLSATLLAALATGALALIATRRVVDTAAILSPLVIAGIVTAAASVLLEMPFNYANVIVLPLMIGIGVDSGVHIALRERNAPGAVFATSTPRAVLFSALTTTAAFGTLALSEHRGTASMGILLSISMLAAVGAVLTLTPAIIRWASHR